MPCDQSWTSSTKLCIVFSVLTLFLVVYISYETKLGSHFTKHTESTVYKNRTYRKESINRPASLLHEHHMSVGNADSEQSKENKDVRRISNADIITTKEFSLAKIIVVVAYYRSGSTLTGALIHQHPGTFYMFEPIRAVYRLFQSKKGNITLDYITGPKIYQMTQQQEVILDEVRAWMKCDLGSISIQTLTDKFVERTESMQPFLKCTGVTFINEKPVLSSLFKNKSNAKRCLEERIKKCKNSSAIVLKTIRAKVSDFGKLLPYFPNMNIVHLLRDPRGMLNSQTSIDNSSLGNSHKIKNICSSIEGNLNNTRKLLKTFPSRIRIQRYEDIAEFPIATTESLYRFVGFRFDNKIRSFMKESTSGKTNSGTWGVRRRNGKQTAMAWRSKISFKQARLVDEHCSRSMKILGYLPFDRDSDMRNLTIKSRILLNATQTLLYDTHN